MALGVICFATVLVSAVMLTAVSNSTSSGPTHVAELLTAQEQATTDTTSYGPWSDGSVLVGNTYTDGLLISGSETSYTGDTISRSQ
jgi:Mn2+/Fe2+ NRAMP family transporter